MALPVLYYFCTQIRAGILAGKVIDEAVNCIRVFSEQQKVEVGEQLIIASSGARKFNPFLGIFFNTDLSEVGFFIMNFEFKTEYNSKLFQNVKRGQHL